MSEILVKDYSQDSSMNSSLTVGSSMLNSTFSGSDSSASSPINTATPLTDSLKYEGVNEVDARPVVTGGIVRTGASPSRVQMSQLIPDAPNYSTGGDEDPALYVLQDGGIRVALTTNALTFFTPITSPSAGSGSGSIYGLGTNKLIVDVGDESFNFDQDFYPTSDGFANLGTATNRWAALYANNIVIDNIVQTNSVTVNGLTITSGTGAPSASEPKGSLYLRTDGSTTNDRMYVATNNSGSWTAVITAT